MAIENVGSDKTGAVGRAAPPAAPVRPSPATAPVASDEGDRVEISAEARALAAQSEAAGGLSPERLAELRRWVQTGAFDRSDVLDAVARRMLERGDI